MDLRLGTLADAQAIADLIIRVARAQLRSEFSDEGWKLFLKLLSLKTQKGLIKDKNFLYLVVVDQDRIVGVLSIKDHSHLFHFFVHPDYQNKGVGKMLWRTYLEDIHNPKLNYGTPQKTFSEVTVNSSDFGLPIYLKLGFKKKSSRQVKNGVFYTPMIYQL